MRNEEVLAASLANYARVGFVVRQIGSDVLFRIDYSAEAAGKRTFQMLRKTAVEPV